MDKEAFHWLCGVIMQGWFSAKLETIVYFLDCPQLNENDFDD
jgi:hypothetical protein